ncbi:hypothetical protein [Enterococcus pallens]|uniref:Uncharacterized protein n=1 Tax=Enterococcus pallens ATCC BAA-351 TaxID=1158607 RepID=R2QM23_9ENTE|nr:hypothetical protein [Enterococcus pallens]EOH96243.1 hypothetical protein UAU_00892 [Enterococcus pallens ATCC BAA-351]EOU14544.1 hypothetical protein I588_04902 [Enterococcus pallens ATCC BAA-351]OJG80965.1 hypothetical protein RV10_GL003964 [Enterococcus pallens]
MLEALQRIKEAETKNEQLKQELQEKLQRAESERRQIVQEKKKQLQEESARIIAEREDSLRIQLEQENAALKKDAAAAKEQMQANYERLKETAVQKIIERVIVQYGSQ